MPKRSDANITSRAAEAAPPGLLWDREVPGFGLRTLPSGARTWLLKYRAPDGRQRWHRIGSFPALTAEQARRAARALRAAVDVGRDPATDRVRERDEARAARAAAAGALADAYAEALPGRPSHRGAGRISAAHAAAEAAAVRRAVARMGAEGLPVGRIAAADLLGLLREEAGRPATARAMFGALGRFFEWCREAGHLAANPCDQIPRAKRPKPPAPRQRVVGLPELARLWRAAEALPDPFGELARLLLAVPVRRGEAAALDWRHVDLRAGVWTLPGSITKNGDPHRIALPPAAAALLRRRHRTAGRPAVGLAFPSPRAGGPVAGWTVIKARLGEAAGFRDWTWHDFRRSFASIMAERGVAEPVADAVLNHRQSGTRGGVLGVYQHARRWPEQRAAMLAWGEALAAAVRAADKAARSAPAARGTRAAPNPPVRGAGKGQPAPARPQAGRGRAAAKR